MVREIVDADDKNCLVQLTVALKFNQGVPAMVVHHCRGAFLWFFLLHKQKKEQSVLFVYLRKGNKIFVAKVNKMTSMTSEEGFSEVVNRVAAAL